MISFRTFLVEESQLSDNEERQIDLIYNTYTKYFNTLNGNDPRVVYSKRLQPNGTMILGSIKYYDEVKRKEGKAYVAVNFDDNLGDADYDRKSDIITLNYKKYDKLTNSIKRNKIVHELLHAKNYKKPTAEYIKATSGSKVGSKRDYYTAQNEFPVQIAAIIHEINLQQRELQRRSKSGSGASFWKKRRIYLLQSIASLIKATKITEVILPPFLADYNGFIDTLYRNRNNPTYVKYFNDFKRKLKHLYNNIQNKKTTEEESSDEVR